jgi:hypothetical protein
MLNEIWWILSQYKMLTFWQKGVIWAIVGAGVVFMSLIGVVLLNKPL